MFLKIKNEIVSKYSLNMTFKIPKINSIIHMLSIYKTRLVTFWTNILLHLNRSIYTKIHVSDIIKKDKVICRRVCENVNNFFLNKKNYLPQI